MTDHPRSMPDESHDAQRASPAPDPVEHRAARPSWLSRALRSPWFLPVAVTVLALRVVLVASCSRLFDPDVWWVAAAGRDMLRTGHIPTSNLWSFTDPTRPWVMHEWLFALPYEWLLTHYGPHAFALVAALATVATLTPVLASVARGRHLLTVLFSAFLATTLFEQRMLSARPPHVALALATTTAWLAFRDKFGPRELVATALIGMLWTNAHGSFVLGGALLIAGLLAHLDAPDRQARAGAVVAFAVSTLINPYGLRLHGLVLEYIFGRSEEMAIIHAHITEFAWVGKALANGHLEPARFAGLVLITLLALFAITQRGMRMCGAAVLVLCLMTVRQLRHLELAGLIGITLLVPAIDLVMDRTRWRVRTEALLQRVHRWIPLVLIAGALVSHAIALAVRPASQWVNDNLGGNDVIALAQEIPSNARVHASFVQTGIVIWYGFPRGIRVLYDLRNDCYGRQAALDALSLNTARLDVLARNRVDTVLVPRTHPLAVALARASEWRVADARGDWMLFLARR